MARTVAPGEKVLVRLALLPGMDPEQEDPSPDEILKMKLSLTDPASMQQMVNDARKQRGNRYLNADQLSAELYLYPRYREATIAYVDRVEGKSTGFVNLDVFTPGSPIVQGQVGKIPHYAQQHFRLDRVQFFTKEPDGGHDQHVAFWAPESEEEAPARLEEKSK